MKFPLRDVERQLITDAARHRPEFAAFKSIQPTLDEIVFTRPALLDFFLRLSLEQAFLQAKKVPPALATLAAARAAAQFIHAEFDQLSSEDRAALPPWTAAMAGDIPPPLATLATIAPTATADQKAKIRAIWSLLGTTESLMETGGDIRLETDPRSALNGYGCSHRPRPWAITFASSTASSSSERGYAAADKIRLRTTAALLAGDKRPAIANSLQAVRHGIARAYGLAAEKIILAASGTDTELLALALTHLAAPDAPIVNILIAPEETGRGVPMAARGHHFAVNTALGADVTFESPIAGFRPDTSIANVFLRDSTGNLRPQNDVEAEISFLLTTGIAQGQKIILHALDLSKTGLLAPSPAFLQHLRAVHGAKFDIVVDACQARLSPVSVRAYLALDAVVLITGSKFFTGPPFAGAAILPPAIAARLAHATLPEGLDAYFGRDEFPANCPAAERLPSIGNYGLALRWHAALAEMQAYLRVPPARRAEILRRFAATVALKISENPALILLPAQTIARHESDEPWERLPSIFSFSLRAPHDPTRNLTPVEARAVYLWLNADLSHLLPGHQAAARICHIGQPVKLPQPGGVGVQGVLRVSAGARLISGEPSHKGLSPKTRITRELADLATVFDKIDLILRNWHMLWAANPAPRYRPAAKSLTASAIRSPLT
jgi:hypothetical protein